MEGQETVGISTNTAQNTPFIPKRPFRFYSSSMAAQSDSPGSLEDRVDGLERRLEKAEHLLHIAEDMNKLHQELEEIRNNEIARKLEDLDSRVKKMELSHADIVFECEEKIKETMTALERGLFLSLESREDDIKQLRSKVEEIKTEKTVAERVGNLEKETGERLGVVLGMLEDVAKLAKKNEYQVSESRETLKQVEGEQVHLLLLAREQEERQQELTGFQEELTALKHAQDEIVEFLRNGSEEVQPDEDVEEVFLRDI